MDESPEQGILRIKYPPAKSVMLDDDREAFCRSIVARNGMAKSYNTAYNVTLSEEEANNMAMLLCENQEVILRVNQLERERMTYRNLTKESVVVGLVDMFNVSLVDYFESDMSGLKDTSEWSEPMRMSAKKIKFGKFGVEFEIADKMAIADKIINIMQYVAPAQNEVVDHGLSKYTDKELAEMAGISVEVEEVKKKKK